MYLDITLQWCKLKKNWSLGNILGYGQVYTLKSGFFNYVFHPDFILLGKNCENDIDDCVGMCMDDNADGCVDRLNDYTCTCKPGYMGKNCTVSYMCDIDNYLPYNEEGHFILF